MLCERLQKKEEGRLFFQPTFLFLLDKKEKLVYNTVSFLFWVFESDNSKEGRRLRLSPFFCSCVKNALRAVGADRTPPRNESLYLPLRGRSRTH